MREEAGQNVVRGGRTIAAATIGLVATSAAVNAASLTWDGNTSFADGVTNATAAWNAASLWRDTAANATWNSLTPDSATFTGATNYNVTVDTATTADTVAFTNTANLVTIAAGSPLTFNTSLTKSGAGSATISAELAGAGSISVSAGTLTLNSLTSSYTGGVTISGGTLALPGTGSALGSGTFAINGGTVTGNNGTYSNATTIGGNFIANSPGGGWTLSNTVNLGGAVRTITATKNLTLNGAVSNGGITKDGAGTLALASASNSFTGNLTINAGTLQINTANTVKGSLILGGTAIYSTNGGARNNTVPELVVNSTNAAAFSLGNFGDSYVIVGSYASPTARNIAVGGTGQLSGTGTINVAVQMKGGTVAPAGTAGTGTFSLAGGLTTYNGSTGGTLLTEVSGASSDVLAVTGNLALGSTSDVLDVTFGATPTAFRYVLATYTGTLTGQFDSLVVHNWSGVGTWVQDYSVAGEVAIVVPEPASAGLIALCGLGLVRRRKKRIA